MPLRSNAAPKQSGPEGPLCFAVLQQALLAWLALAVDGDRFAGGSAHLNPVFHSAVVVGDVPEFGRAACRIFATLHVTAGGTAVTASCVGTDQASRDGTAGCRGIPAASAADLV